MKYVFLHLVLCLTIAIPAKAQTLNFQEALANYQKLNLTMPVAQPDGRIQTFNKKGGTSPTLDYATLNFIQFAQNKSVLEIGGAYGLVMAKVLKNAPQTTYHINDLDARHLYIAADYLLNNQKIPLQILQAQTKFISGNFTQLKINNQYDAILVARVLHFMSPQELDQAINDLYIALKPGGRVYVVAITPYVKRFQKFISEYEARLRKQMPYPGYVLSLHDWLDKETTSAAQQRQISDEPFMFLDTIVLTKLFAQKGFEIMECKTESLGYHSDSWSLDGRENVVLIAKKPKL